MKSSSKRTLNVRFLLIVLVSTLVVAGGVHAVHIFQVSRNAKVLLAQATEAESKKDLTEAIRRFEQYVNFEPGDGDAQRRLAMLLASDDVVKDEVSRSRAISALERAVRLEPDERETRLKLIRLLIDQSSNPRYADLRLEAKGQIETLARLIEEKNTGKAKIDGEVEALRGDFEMQFQKDKAIEAFRRSIEALPNQVEPYQKLAYLLRERKDRVSRTSAATDEAQADLLMDAREIKSGVIASNPKSARAYLARALYVAAYFKDVKGAMGDIQTALKLDPADTQVLFEAAKFANSEGEIEVARAHLEKGISIDPKALNFYLFLAAIESRVGNVEKAAKVFEDATKAMPENTQENLLARYFYADTLISAKMIEQARPVLASLREKGFKKPLLDMLDARILMLGKEWAKAAELLEQAAPLLDERSESYILKSRDIARKGYYLLSQAYLNLSNRDQQINSLRRALNVAEVSEEEQAQLRVELARALSDAGEHEKAEAEYRRSSAVGTRGGAASRLELIRFTLENISRKPASQRNWGDVESMIDELARAEPKNPAPVVFRAQVLATQGKMAEATALIQKQLKATPKEPMLWSALITLAERGRNGVDVLSTLDRARAELGNHIEVRLIEIRVYGNATTAEGKARLAAALKDVEKLSPEDQGRIYMTLGTTMARGGRIDEAYNTFLLWKKAEPLSITPLLVLYDVAIIRKDRKAQSDMLGEIRKLEGESGPNWRFVKARALLEQATTEGEDEKKKVEQLTEAERLLTESIKSRATWGRAYMGLGQIQELLKRPKDAIGNYYKALEFDERDAGMIRRLVLLLYQGGKYSEANDVLKMAQERIGLTDDMVRMASGISIQTQDFDRALSLATAAAGSEKASDADRLWLNQVLLVTGQRAESEGKPAEAQEHYKKAEDGLRKLLQKSPANPEAWILLVQTLTYARQKAAAEAAAAEAAKALKDAKDQGRARQAVATCLSIVGKTEDAAKIYRESIAANPKDSAAIRNLAQLLLQGNSRDEAKALLDQLVSIKDAAPRDAEWAYRTKAILAAMQNGYQGTMEGIKLLEAAPAKSIEDRRARARLLASIRNRESREQASAILEELIKADPPSSEDIYLLAQIYEAGGKWPRARELYQKLIATQARNAGVISVYVRALIKNKDLGEAQVWLDRLAQIAPQDVGTQELRARLLAEKGNKPGAADILKTLGRRDAQNLLFAAGVLENLKIYDAAEELYRTLAATPQPPTNPLYLAAFLGRIGRTGEALDVAEKSWGQVKPNLSSNLSVQILYGSKGLDEDCERVARKIDEALKTNPNSSDLLFDLANVRSLQARYSEAEEIYRKLWEADRNNAATLNNLAWLLALQDNPKGAEALEAVATAIKQMGPTPDILDTRAVAHIAAGSYAQAIKDLKDAIAIKPEPVMYIHLALAHLRANNKGEARAALNEARINGFAPETLHPLERRPYQELIKVLGAE